LKNLSDEQVREFWGLSVLPAIETATSVIKEYSVKVTEEARNLAVNFHQFLTPFPEIEEKLKAFAEQIKESKPESFDDEKHWNFIMWSFWNEVDNLLP